MKEKKTYKILLAKNWYFTKLYFVNVNKENKNSCIWFSKFIKIEKRLNQFKLQEKKFIK